MKTDEAARERHKQVVDRWAQNRTGNQLGDLIREETGIDTSPSYEDWWASLTDEQLATVAVRCGKELTEEGITVAVKATVAMPFDSWPNRDLRSNAAALLEASRLSYDDPRQSVAVARVLKDLTTALAIQLVRGVGEQEDIAQRLNMLRTGSMGEKPEDIHKSIWDSIQALEREKQARLLNLPRA